MNRLGPSLVLGMALCGLAGLSGCENEIARESDVDIKDDGTVKTREKTVTENPDGSTTVREEKETTRP
ncbi:MAG: hypothetical protein L0Y44_09110 [Phycisphaerales bacterium]|nr:hypothetical protein [Terriglobales bacterium]MCI0630796.1 hypothetical protein [Phycisphaerales bacterium]MCI0675177.1 hypothetical protein [Phycisphaerales bacterium]